MIKGTSVQMMVARWGDRLGDWHPQLLRELQGRLSWGNCALTLFTSIAVQWLIFSSLRGIGRQKDPLSVHSQYCQVPSPLKFPPQEMADCAPKWINHALIQQHQSQSQFLLMGVVMVFALIVFGVYLITVDILRERHRGTITFIQASPQTSGGFIWGKVLGVPILLYGAIAAAIPYHLWMARVGGISGLGVVCFYLVLILGGMVFCQAALLGSLLFPPRYQVMALINGAMTAVFLLITNFYTHTSYYSFKETEIIQLQFWLKLFSPTLVLTTLPERLADPYSTDYLRIPFDDYRWDQPTWFDLPITASTLQVTVWMIIQYGVCLYLLQKGLNRKFTAPQKPLLTKLESYSFVALCQGIWLGFLVDETWYFPTSVQNPQFHWEPLELWLGLSGGLLALMLVLLMPSRQELSDAFRVARGRRGGRFSRLFTDPHNSMMPMAIAHSLITLGAIAPIPAFFKPQLFTFSGEPYPAIFLVILLGFAWGVTVNGCQLCILWGWSKLWAWGVSMILFTIHGILILMIVIEHVPFWGVVMAEGAIALLLSGLNQQKIAANAATSFGKFQ